MSLFVLVPILIAIMFVIVISLFVFGIARGIGQWSYNNGQPILTAPARVITKRTQTSGSTNINTGGSVSTWYYVTYELESGERLEFVVGGREYGMLAEGDSGTLTYQGTRYKRFERDTMTANRV